MGKTTVIILVSSACGGKDLLLNKAVNTFPQLHKMVSVTTRPMRINEKDGYDYYFISYDDFINHEFGYIETRIYNTEHGDWYYGLPKSEIIEGVTNIVIVDAHGTEELKVYCESKGYECISIYLKVPFVERIKRYIDRDNMTDSQCFEMCRRFLDDKINLETYAKECDYICRNETKSDLLYNLYQIGEIINGEDI